MNMRARRRFRETLNALADHAVGLALACAVVAASCAGAAIGALVVPEPAHAAGARTISDVYGVSRAEVVRWLMSHESDDYYLGTPYRPYDWRSPRGDINGYGAASDGVSAGMNCTGFVWHALCAAHGFNDSIASRLPALSGWNDAISTENLLTYSFETKQQMLSSGVLEKGDIIWMWANGDPGTPSDSHHIGIFWGNRPDEDLIWHSSGDEANGWSGTNEKSFIHGKADRVTFQVLKLGGQLCGSVALAKGSGVPDITASNPNYSLQGALYGLFDSRQKALTRLAGNARATFRTDAGGSWKTGSDIPVGTYYVAELAAPTGYALDDAIYEVVVAFDQTTQVGGARGVTDTPISNPVSLWAAKSDAETVDGGAQGGATLEGTLFEVCYYSGYYTAQTLPGTCTRRWVVAAGSDGRALADDAHKVSGDAYYRTAGGQVTIPLGTVTVREAQAPRGYRDGVGDVSVIRIESSGSEPAISVYAAPAFRNEVKRGGVVIGKVDRQLEAYLPQGAATLAGAVFEVVSLNDQQVVVGGNTYGYDEVVQTIRTERREDSRYLAATAADALPVGSYELREREAPEGYLLDERARAWRYSFTIAEDGEIADAGDSTHAATDLVKRGDFSFSKVESTTSRRLSGVAFAIESNTTGETHIGVTDENGMLSTAASWNPHSLNANRNDGALVDGEGLAGGVDDEKLDASAGIWFSGRTDASCAPDDALGALPYDTYTVTELRSGANEGLQLARFTVDITRDRVDLDLGTVDDESGPLVGTSLADDNGVKLAPADADVTITDEVRYANLEPRRTYTLIGTLHEVAEDGSDAGVVTSASTTFKPDTPDGSSQVAFKLNTRGRAGQKLVAYEQLVDEGGQTLATHEDLAYEGQTVRVPTIATSLALAGGGGKAVPLGHAVELVDTVSYEGLTPGETYVMEGTLHKRDSSGKDAGVAKSPSCETLGVRHEFTAKADKGTVEVSFSVDPDDFPGQKLVAFESLMKKGEVYAAHADIADDAQAVQVEGKPEAAPRDTLPKTGDDIPLGLLAGAFACALSVAVASFIALRSRRRTYIRIERGANRLSELPDGRWI